MINIVRSGENGSVQVFTSCNLLPRLVISFIISWQYHFYVSAWSNISLADSEKQEWDGSEDTQQAQVF